MYKMVFGFGRCTPSCVMLKETKRDEIRFRAEQRTMQYEERTRNATGVNVLKECLKEERQVTKTKDK